MSCSRPGKQRHRLYDRKRGVVLICVVACLAIATLLLAGMVKRTLLTRRQIRTERHVRQAEWLVQAGAERAAFRLASDAEYTGESWSLAADAIVGTDPGVVSISASRDSADLASVRVVAEYPSGRAASIRRTREFLVDLSISKEETIAFECSRSRKTSEFAASARSLATSATTVID